MERFFVRLYVETLASIAANRDQYKEGSKPIWRFHWKTDDVRLVLYDRLRDEKGALVHEGLGLDLDVPACSVDEAIPKAQNLAEGLVNLISYVTMAACKTALVVSSHGIPEAPADTDVVWIHQKTRVPLGDLKPINSDRLNAAYGLYDKVTEENKWRISKALQWLRKGLIELDTVGQFIAYWVGLESTSSVLMDILSLKQQKLWPTCSKCKHEIRACPECEESLGRPNQMASVAVVFEQYVEGGKKTYSRLRALRGKLFHGGKKLQLEFLKELAESLPFAQEALSVAIGLMLGMDHTELKEIAASKPRRAMRPIRVKVLGQLVEFDAPTLEQPDQQPYVEQDPEEEYTITSDGKLNVAFKQTLTMRNGSFQATGYEMWGDEHSMSND